MYHICKILGTMIFSWLMPNILQKARMGHCGYSSRYRGSSEFSANKTGLN